MVYVPVSSFAGNLVAEAQRDEDAVYHRTMQTAMRMNAKRKSDLALVLAQLLWTTGRVLSGLEHQRIE